MERHVIQVNHREIDRGKPGDPRGCALALAVPACVPGAEDVKVVPWVVFWTRDGVRYRGKLPGSAVNFVWEFDSRRPVTPIAFPLDVGAVSGSD